MAAIDAQVEQLPARAGDTSVFLVDEVAKMGCHSATLVSAMRLLLRSSIPIVLTVAERRGGFITEVRDSEAPGCIRLISASASSS